MSTPLPAPAAASAAAPAADEHAAPFVGLLFWVAVVFSVFQIVTAAFSPLSSSVVRAVHVGFLLLVTFALRPPFKLQAQEALSAAR